LNISETVNIDIVTIVTSAMRETASKLTPGIGTFWSVLEVVGHCFKSNASF